MASRGDSLRAPVDELVWYHTIDLGDGIVTPGIYDTRRALSHVPLPASLAGKRCLDVGTADGFWAFEMERRGASEVIAIDIGRAPLIDLPDDPSPPSTELADPRPPRTFEIAHEARRSRVRWQALAAEDVSPASTGGFDFVFLGSLLLHLRDPFRALAAVRRVVEGELLVNEAVVTPLSVLKPRTPAAQMAFAREPVTWWIPNVRGLRHMVESAGFEARSWSRPYLLRHGRGLAGSPFQLLPSLGLRPIRSFPLRVALHVARRPGMPHAWVLASPGRTRAG